MKILKDKIIKLFYEDNNEELEENEEVTLNVIIRRIIMACSIVFNFIFNIMYVSLFCYSGETKVLSAIVFLLSFIWAILSLVSSYKLYGKYSRLLFYLNLFVVMFISKLWFVYL